MLRPCAPSLGYVGCSSSTIDDGAGRRTITSLSILCCAQGIETVRRDNCQLVRTVVSTCLDKILIEEDIEGAKEYVRNTISDLLMNRMDLSLLVITKVSIYQSHCLKCCIKSFRCPDSGGPSRYKGLT